MRPKNAALLGNEFDLPNFNVWLSTFNSNTFKDQAIDKITARPHMHTG